MVQVRYSKTVPEPDRILAKVGECRAVMIDASSKVRPFGPAYHILSSVIVSINALATFITGKRDYFATRLKGDLKPMPTFPPHTLDLDEHPHATADELAPFQPKE